MVINPKMLSTELLAEDIANGGETKDNNLGTLKHW